MLDLVFASPFDSSRSRSQARGSDCDRRLSIGRRRSAASSSWRGSRCTPKAANWACWGKPRVDVLLPDPRPAREVSAL